MAAQAPMDFGTRPWLVQATRDKSLHLVDVLDRSLHEWFIPEMEGKTCLGCVYDGSWLIALDESTSECFLLHLTTVPRRRNKIQLPPLRAPLEFLSTCAMLEHPGHPDCTVVITSDVRSLLHCRPGDQKWTRLVTPPLQRQGIIAFSHTVINYEGKLYSFASMADLVVLDLADGVVPVRHMGTINDDEVRVWSGYRIFVESSGDLFAVLIQELGFLCSDGVLTDIAVFRLDLDEPMAWKKVDSIGFDRAFVIASGYGFSCDATHGRLEGNCVYLVWSCCDCERLYKFCLDDMTVSFHQILPRPTHNWCRAFWSVPAK
ncbi:hypothetical protein QOZ80_8BG0661710 [Eleusine coracana subsp. coracana]|nr:hypothetical protein QOZ80_8BG0661710 [Eleusine coracana subsp. coracana]